MPDLDLLSCIRYLHSESEHGPCQSDILQLSSGYLIQLWSLLCVSCMALVFEQLWSITLLCMDNGAYGDIFCSCVHLNLRLVVLHITGCWMHWAFTNLLSGSILGWMSLIRWCPSVRCVCQLNLLKVWRFIFLCSCWFSPTLLLAMFCYCSWIALWQRSGLMVGMTPV